MPEQNNAADQGQDKGTGAGENNSNAGAENKPANQAGNEGAGNGENKGGEGAQNQDLNKGQDKKDNAKAPDNSQKGADDDGKDPEVKPRKTPQDFIIERKNRKIAKLQNKGDQGEGEGGEGDEEENEVAPEDADLIKKVVSPMIAPIVEKSLEAEDEKEIQEFLKENSDFKPYEQKVRRFMKHPSRRQLPIKSLFYEVAGDDLLKIGADRKAKADEEAKHSQSGGGSNRAGEGQEKSAWELPKDEFEAKKEKIRRGQ